MFEACSSGVVEGPPLAKRPRNSPEDDPNPYLSATGDGEQEASSSGHSEQRQDVTSEEPDMMRVRFERRWPDGATRLYGPRIVKFDGPHPPVDFTMPEERRYIVYTTSFFCFFSLLGLAATRATQGSCRPLTLYFSPIDQSTDLLSLDFSGLEHLVNEMTKCFGILPEQIQTPHT